MHDRWRGVLIGSLLVMVGFVGGSLLGPALWAPRVLHAADSFPVPADIAQPMADFWQAYTDLNRDSYWAPFNHSALIYSAINGMLSNGTNDPHTLFLSPQQNSVAQSTLQGNYQGIGSYVTAIAAGLELDPLRGSPAALHGLRAHDVVIAVDGRSIAGISQDAAVALIRGPVGSIVRLTIKRAGIAAPFVVAVPRGTIAVPSVNTALYGSQRTVGYLAINDFGQTTPSEVTAALAALLTHKLTGLVIDLRDNGGGYVSSAVAIASQFIAHGVVVYEQQNDKTLTALSVQPGGLATTLPLAVVVNGNTASAAEILSGALQDDHRAVIVGTRTYGKGSVQEDIALTDGASLRITTRLWLTPLHHLVQGTGITPNIAVASQPTATQVGTAADLPLQHAIGYLLAHAAAH